MYIVTICLLYLSNSFSVSWLFVLLYIYIIYDIIYYASILIHSYVTYTFIKLKIDENTLHRIFLQRCRTITLCNNIYQVNVYYYFEL